MLIVPNGEIRSRIAQTIDRIEWVHNPTIFCSGSRRNTDIWNVEEWYQQMLDYVNEKMKKFTREFLQNIFGI